MFSNNNYNLFLAQVTMQLTHKAQNIFYDGIHIDIMCNVSNNLFPLIYIYYK